MKNFEKVTYRTQGKRITKLLEVIEANNKFLRGFEVNREGERIYKENKFDQRLHIIALCVITNRIPLIMNLHYLTLEVKK